LWIGLGSAPDAMRRRAAPSSDGSCGPHPSASSGTCALASRPRTVATCSSSPWCEEHAIAISASPASRRPAAIRRNGSAWRGLTQLRSVVSAAGVPAELSTFPVLSTTATWPRTRASTTVPRQTVASTGGAGSFTELTLTPASSFWYGPAIAAGKGHIAQGTAGITAQPRGAAIATHVHRLVRHLWVLATAAVLVVLVARPAQVPGAPMLRNLAAIQINAVVQNATAVTAVAVEPVKTIVVQPGQTLAALATDYHVSASTIQWGNQLTPSVAPKAGSTLLIPPGPGALVEVLPGETPTEFAARLHLDPAVILDYNALSSNSPMLGGSYLQVPLSRAPAGALIASYFVDAQNDVPSVPPQIPLHDGFPYGQCTYYVATRRTVAWSGNAIDWWRAARGKRPEGRVPVQGAIVVFNIGWVGHVAYVEHVNLDGTFTVSEMNYRADGGGWGRVDYRTISTSDPSIVGFIY